MIIINGVQYSGNNVSISNNQVIIDGKVIKTEEKEINITVTANIEKLDVVACSKLEVTGSVGSIKTTSGDVNVNGDVNGSIQTMSGDVDCGHVQGSVSTMSGDIKHRKQ